MTELATVQANAVAFEAVQTTVKVKAKAVTALVTQSGKTRSEALASLRVQDGADILALALATNKGMAAAVAARSEHEHATTWRDLVAAYGLDTAASVARCHAVRSVAACLDGFTMAFSVRADGVQSMKRADWIRALDFAATAANKKNTNGKPASGAKDAAAALAVLQAWDARIEATRNAQVPQLQS